MMTRRCLKPTGLLFVVNQFVLLASDDGQIIGVVTGSIEIAKAKADMMRRNERRYIYYEQVLLNTLSIHINGRKESEGCTTR